MRRVALLALLLLVPPLVAACGAGLASAPNDDAADVVPASADLYVALDGELEGEGWAQVEALLDRFPRLGSVFDDALDGSRTEWNAALGPELAFAVVNLEYREAVALTQPDDPGELRRLVEDEGGAAEELERGWWAAARDARAIDRLRGALEADGPLSERDDFRRLAGDLPEDAFATVFVRGGPADDALADLHGLPAPLGRTLDCVAAGREIPSAAFALRPEEEGVRLDGALDRPEGWPDGGGVATIADAAPAGAILFAGASSLPKGVDLALACAAGADGEAMEMLQTLGLGATALLSGETAVAVYPAAERRPPTVALYAEVEDGERTLATVDELAGLAAALVPGLTVEDVELGGDGAAPAKVVELEGEPVLYLGVARGLLVASNAGQGVEGLLAEPDEPLGADARFGGAAESLGGTPADADALLYLDVQAALGQAHAPGARGGWAEELAALDTLLLTATASDDTVRVEGLLAID